MSLNRTSDSLSRCDPNLYSNVYDVRKRSDIKTNPASATRPIHKDTIEISRDKLQEEALNRLRHTSKYVIAHNSFMRIGKYLFLAVAFPPYLLLYGLPKWILVEAVPAIFSQIVQIFQLVQKKSEKHLLKMSRQIEKTFHTMQKMGRAFIQPIIRLTLEFRQSIQRMRESAQQWISAFAKKNLRLSGLKIQERASHLRNKIGNLLGKVKLQAEFFGNRIHENMQGIVKTPQLFLGWGQIQIQKLFERAASWSAPLKERLKTSEQLAQRTTKWLSKQMKNGSEGLKGRLKPFANFYQQKWLPAWQAFKNGFKGKWEQTRDYCHKRHQKALAYLNRKQEKLKKLSHHHLVEHLANVWIAKLPSRLQETLKNLLKYPLAIAILKAIFRTYSILANVILGGGSHLLKLIYRFSEKSLKAFGQLRKMMKGVVQKVSSICKSGCHIFLKSFLNVLYYIILYMIIFAIIIKWGVSFLGRCMGTLTNQILKLRFG